MSKFKAVLVPGGYYHIFNRAVGSEKIFIVNENYRYFLRLYEKYIGPIAESFCYCLLPNHFHFFMRIKEPEALYERITQLQYRAGENQSVLPIFLLQQFSNFFNAYTKGFNRQQDRKGKLFIESFNRKALSDPAYYTRLIYYVHTNPVHHGICRHANEWPHSSYWEIINQQGWCRHEEVIEWFGSIGGFKRFHGQEVERKPRPKEPRRF